MPRGLSAPTAITSLQTKIIPDFALAFFFSIAWAWGSRDLARDVCATSRINRGVSYGLSRGPALICAFDASVSADGKSPVLSPSGLPQGVRAHVLVELAVLYYRVSN